MERTSRRIFMKQAGTAAAVAGAVAVAPIGVANAVAVAGTKPTAAVPSAGVTPLAGSGASAGGDLIAHLKDASTGEISLFVGTREVVIHDQNVAARFIRATR